MRGQLVRRRLSRIFAAVLLMSCVLAHAADGMPVLAWFGPPAEHTTVERLKELAAAGFTHNFSGFPNLAAMQAALDMAEAAGVKLLAACPELRHDTAATVNALKDHPALAGYYLRDEPGAEAFPELAEWVRAIQAVDDEHFCYINLFPTYASSEQLGTETYEEHVNLFLDTVPVPILSFDHYPVLEQNGEIVLRGDYYRNLRIIAHAARERKMPFWGFALSVAHDPYPLPTVAHMHLQVHSNLIYGAQAIQYFTYWTPQSSQWDFHNAPIDVEGKRTPTYERVQVVNADLAPVRAIFHKSEVIQTGHIGAPMPEGVHEFILPPPFTHCDTDNQHALLGHIVKGDRAYLAVMNPSLHDDLEVALTYEGSMALAAADGGLEPLDTGAWRGTIVPGDMRLLSWTP
jgi:hypothetical protein